MPLPESLNSTGHITLEAGVPYKLDGYAAKGFHVVTGPATIEFSLNGSDWAALAEYAELPTDSFEELPNFLRFIRLDAEAEDAENAVVVLGIVKR